MPRKLRPTPAACKPVPMPFLTPREQILILAVLAAVLVGMAVKHWRDARREIPSATAQPRAAARN